MTSFFSIWNSVNYCCKALHLKCLQRSWLHPVFQNVVIMIFFYVIFKMSQKFYEDLYNASKTFIPSEIIRKSKVFGRMRGTEAKLANGLLLCWVTQYEFVTKKVIKVEGTKIFNIFKTFSTNMYKFVWKNTSTVHLKYAAVNN